MTGWKSAVPLLLLLLSGCRSHAEGEMSPDEREAIAVEIRQTLDRYAEAHGRRDADEISSFWGDSGGLRF